MAHYDCTRCGESFGISPEMCPKCQTDSDYLKSKITNDVVEVQPKDHLDKWDKRFLDMAQLVGSWSKDPSTKCGAVIVRPDRTVASVGFNGFPRECSDHQDLYDERELKYDRVVHAEVNAILAAADRLDNCTLYLWSGPAKLFTCARCAGPIIQSGISRVVSTRDGEYEERWRTDHARALEMYTEAGVQVDVLNVANHLTHTGTGFPLS